MADGSRARQETDRVDRPRTVKQGRFLVLFAAIIATATIAASAVPGEAATVPPATDVSKPDVKWLSGDPKLSRRDREIMNVQAPYLELDEKVRGLAANEGSSPLAGTRLDIANRRLYVYWAGAAPNELSVLQAEARKAGISLLVTRAPFSERQLMAAANRLGTIAQSEGLSLEIELSAEGSGLTVSYKGLRTAAEAKATRTPAQSQILNAIAAVRSKTGVAITVQDAHIPAAATRTWADRINDWSPFWGGAVTATGGGRCTDAFSMYATGAPARFMLTAAHCSGFLDGQVVTNGVGQRMGVTDFIHELFDDAPRYDLGVVRLDSGLGNQPRVYRNQTTADGLVIKGMSKGIPANATYCVSGAVGVPNCNLISGGQVLLCDQPRLPTPFNRCIYFISFGSTTGGATICSGDSGGPVYFTNSTGVIAAGVVSAGDPRADDTGPCFHRTLISVVASAVGRISGLRVVTAP
jgi:hypothetical protein